MGHSFCGFLSLPAAFCGLVIRYAHPSAKVPGRTCTDSYVEVLWRWNLLDFPNLHRPVYSELGVPNTGTTRRRRMFRCDFKVLSAAARLIGVPFSSFLFHV